MAATLRICLPANQCSISTMEVKMRVASSGRRAISSRNTWPMIFSKILSNITLWFYE